MKSMRPSFALLISSLGATLLFANCTIKSVEDDGTGGKGGSSTNNGDVCATNDTKACTCTNGKKGAQECNDAHDGYDKCVCDGVIDTGGTGNAGGTGNEPTAGKTSEGGTTSTSYGGANDAGAGGEAPVVIDPTDCDACLSQLCAAEYDACGKDAQCPDQYGAVLDCITTERGNGLVKRDAVRGCGVTIGASPDPSTPAGAAWAPEQMAQATTDLINCLATNDGDDVSWANDDANFTPTIVPWKDGTCAKLACTSEIK